VTVLLAWRSRLLAATLDDVIAWAMLAVALVLVASVGISHARALQYGPIDEAAHVGYVERIAQTGLPPDGHDSMVGRPVSHVGPNDTVLPAADPGGFPAGFAYGARLPQVEFIQPPLYYYALAPVALAVSPYRTVFALRLASLAFILAATALLFLAVRLTAPERPLAAGLATVILGTMSGLMFTLTQVQNDSLLIAMFALVFWLLCRDLPGRRASYGLTVAVGLIAVTQIVAIPFAAAVLVWACWRALERPAVLGEAARFALPRFAIAAVPLTLWVVWNVAKYHSVFPGGGGLTISSAGPKVGPSMSDALLAAQTAVTESFADFWGVGFVPRVADPRPAPLLCAILVVCAIAVLASDGAKAVQLRLARWAGFAAVAFVSAYATIFLAVLRSGGLLSFSGRYFVGVAVAWAAVVALTIDAAAGRHVWLARGVSIALSVVLVRYALQYSTLSLRVF
jgi:hypothetical protein